MNIQARDQVKQLLQFGLRENGYGKRQFPDLKIIPAQNPNILNIAMGSTIISALISKSVFMPPPEHPNEGKLRFIVSFGDNIDYKAMDMTREELIKESQILSTLIDDLFKSSGAVDLESLCVIAKVKAFDMVVTLTVLADGGCVLDACSAAALAVLLYHQTYTDLSDGCIPLLQYPLFITYAMIEDASGTMHVVSGPTCREEIGQSGYLSIGINSYGEVCALRNKGIENSKAALVNELLTISGSRSKDIAATILSFINSLG